MQGFTKDNFGKHLKRISISSYVFELYFSFSVNTGC